MTALFWLIWEYRNKLIYRFVEGGQEEEDEVEETGKPGDFPRHLGIGEGHGHDREGEGVAYYEHGNPE